jgi:hypothetical protein
MYLAPPKGDPFGIPMRGQAPVMRTAETALETVESALSRTRWAPSLCAEIRSAYHAAATHSVFGQLTSTDRLAVFMSKHVWAVWDFMSLVKSVQSVLAPQTLPWTPPVDPVLARLINEIVLEEESGFRVDGKVVSHFEFYLHAMRQGGAETQRIEGFLGSLITGTPVDACLGQFAPPAAARFVRQTLTLAGGTPGERVAAFVFGRGKLIPDVFPILSEHLPGANIGIDLEPFRQHLVRRVDLADDERGPAVLSMLEAWAADEEKAGYAALRALQARIDLWDHALSAVSGAP